MTINFYPLTSTEQAIFITLTNSRVNNEPVLILTQPTELLIGVDSDDLQDSLYIDYFNLITFDSDKIQVIDLEVLEIFTHSKKQKELEIETWFTAVIAAGFDTELGFSLRFDESNRFTYTAYTVLLEHSVARGSKQAIDNATILDGNGVPRQILVSDLIDTFTDYGEAFEILFATHITLLTALEAAQTDTDINNIIVPPLP